MLDSPALSALAAGVFIALLLAALGFSAAVSATARGRLGWSLALLAGSAAAFGWVFWRFGG